MMFFALQTGAALRGIGAKLALGAMIAVGGGMAHGAGAPQDFVFSSIDGGDLRLSDFRGHPVLVINTASRCGFTGQYADMQALYDQFRGRGLVVLAVPSDDFGQELSDNAAVKEFCAVNYDIDMPMTEITRVKGTAAHPFYQWLAKEHGVRPRWNFSKALIGPDGAFVESWGSFTKPTSGAIIGQIEPLLN